MNFTVLSIKDIKDLKLIEKRMSRSSRSDGAFLLLEELMFTHHALSEKEAISKENLLSGLDRLQFFKDKGYVSELSDGKIYLTAQGMQALLAHFS
ncbi:MAG: hypothetical protein ACUVQ8_07190 [Nitrososphaeria archaeon]